MPQPNLAPSRSPKLCKSDLYSQVVTAEPASENIRASLASPPSLIWESTVRNLYFDT
jgi:hypothetical protein